MGECRVSGYIFRLWLHVDRLSASHLFTCTCGTSLITPTKHASNPKAQTPRHFGSFGERKRAPQEKKEPYLNPKHSHFLNSEASSKSAGQQDAQATIRFSEFLRVWCVCVCICTPTDLFIYIYIHTEISPKPYIQPAVGDAEEQTVSGPLCAEGRHVEGRWNSPLGIP